MQTKSVIFNTEDFKQLAYTHEPLCLSVYVPAYRAGQEVKEQHAQKILKNIIKQVRSELLKRELSENDADVYLRPLTTLMEDNEFWTDQSDGLAIFITPNSIKKFKVPIHFAPYYYIADHFYLKPLIPMLNNDDIFYILAFNLDEVKLYESTPYTIAEMDTSDVPQKLEDVVGNETEQRHLQQRTGHDNSGNAIFHGHGGGKDDKQTEVKQFLREVDKKISGLLNGSSYPLILACDEQQYAIYKDISGYNNLSKNHIPLNPKEIDPLDLHHEATIYLQEEFGQTKTQKINSFRQYSATDKTLTEIEDIVPAAVNGQIDTLFIQPGKETFGLFDKENNTIIIDREKQTQNASLYNLAAVNTVLNNGKVYLLPQDKMPLHKTNANALLRY